MKRLVRSWARLYRHRGFAVLVIVVNGAVTFAFVPIPRSESFWPILICLTICIGLGIFVCLCIDLYRYEMRQLRPRAKPQPRGFEVIPIEGTAGRET